MAATGPRPIVPSLTVQEKGSRKVFVYVDIPELKVKRSFPNFTKQIPTNGEQRTLDFQNRSLIFTLHVQTKHNETKIYSLSVARLPGDIRPEHCSIKYQRGGCWITLTKAETMCWMDRICDDYSPGLDTQESDIDQNTPASAPVEEIQLRDTDMKPPFNLVPLAPPPPPPVYRSLSTKSPAPPPPPPRSSTAQT